MAELQEHTNNSTKTTNEWQIAGIAEPMNDWPRRMTNGWNSRTDEWLAKTNELTRKTDEWLE